MLLSVVSCISFFPSVGDHDGRGQHFAHLQYPDGTDTECFKHDEAITLNCSHSDLGGPGIIYWLYSGSGDGNTAAVLRDSGIPNAVYHQRSGTEDIVRISPIQTTLNGQTVQCQYQIFVSGGQRQTVTSNKATVLLAPGAY